LDSKIAIITPFEAPDVPLAVAAARSGAFSILHLGRNHEVATDALATAAQRLQQPFGVCIADETVLDLPLPAQVSHIILPWGLAKPKGTKAEILWQVHSVAEAEEALSQKAKALILKGSEGAGKCSDDSSFFLFQSLLESARKAKASLYIQGGVGVHSAAAYLTLGAQGVILDSQVALFPECGLSEDLKTTIGRLSGSEIRTNENYHYLLRPGAPDPGEEASFDELLPRIGVGAEQGCLPLGQDAILALDYALEYRRLRYLVKAIEQATDSHLRLAQTRDALTRGDAMSDYLGTELPLAQGPMARISDVPAFLRNVADGGALPFLAMSMMRGEAAKRALAETAEALEDKAWGVGILGFAYPKMLEEQIRLIREAKPPVVLIAGGRPSQAKAFEQDGIKVFLHVPAAGLLEMFLREGARSFIFEGRESGGHVGPLFSTVLWEKQMNLLLAHEDTASLNLFFAGGIHDEFSAAFARLVTIPLSARGARVGVIAGTAYLFTKEIVESGAITEEYRRLLIEGNSTVLLKSGKGQETRSVPSPFTEFFAAERRRMLDEGIDTVDVLMKLEDLNIGRLRIASKGIERQGDELVELSTEAQWEKGLYMTGAVTPLIDKITTIEEVHSRLIDKSRSLLKSLKPSTKPEEASPASGEVAVIGMAALFPDAEDLDEYWRNILFGKNSITEVPPVRWSTELFYDPDPKDTDHVVSKWGGFIGAADFDALEFGITPQSLAAIEPIQLLSLLITKRAFEDAGYDDLSEVDLENTSVIFGAQGAGELTTAYGFRAGLRHMFGDLAPEFEATLPRLTEDSFPGVLSNVISGRISNRLNTGGRNFTVDAACASSLAALDIAFGELTSHRADMVVLGGADAHNSIGDFLMFSSTFALSKRGYCATFDKDADGIALGEGVGVLLLKRLEDAERDGDKIHAVIKGVGASSDGKNLGLTAPSRHGQIKALEDAYTSSGIHPSDVGLIEAHGTGTVVGDRIELGALTDVFLDAGTLPNRAQLGSVKTQIGHTKCAAGAAGLIKAVLAVKHGIRPATLNLKAPNAAYVDGGPFFFRTDKAGLWSEERRVAGVSGFGFGGTNFHTLLENYETTRPDTVLKAWPSELLVFRGKSAEEARELMEKVRTLLLVNNRLKLRDIAYSLACYGEDDATETAIQYVIVATGREELLARIEATLGGESADGVYPLEPLEGKVAFLFPGQGSQRVDMAADLFVIFPKLRRLLEAHPEYEQILFPPAAFNAKEKAAQRDAITNTLNAQPLLGLVDLGIAELLRDFGVVADMACGHSYGELPALSFAGAIAADDLLDLSRARAQAVLDAVGEDPGRMIAVSTDQQTLEGLLEGEKELWAVNLNAPRQTVVAGTSAAIAAFADKLKEAEVNFTELNVAAAFHSPLLKAAEGIFGQALKDIKLSKPALDVWSNTTADRYPQTAVAIKRRLGEHLVKPVRFVDEIEAMYEDGARVFIEVGPGGVLTGLTDKILADKETLLIQTERKGAEGISLLLHGLGRYIASGRTIDLKGLFVGRGTKVVDIDQPENYRKKGTVWNVDGQRAVPENGNLPAHAGKLTGPGAFGNFSLNAAYAGASPEQIMMSYLDNMNAVIQDQRDVMLGYLGQTEAIPRAAVAPRRFETAVPAAALPASPIDISTSEAETVAADTSGALPSIVELSTEEVSAIILDVVSEKTGYPIDMLDFSANLEADLSIDSIKKMEIVGGLRERAAFPDDEDDMEESFEKLISIKTLQEMLDWIQSLEAGSGSSSSSEGLGAIKATADAAALSGSADEATDTDDEADATTINRLIPIEKLVALKESEQNILEGAHIALTDEGTELTARIAEALKARGAVVDIITADTADLTEFDGLVLVNVAASKIRYHVTDLFELIKRADLDKLKVIYTFDDAVGTLLESDDLSRFDLLEGFAGFIKSIKHEHNDKRLCAISLFTPADAESLPALVAGELSVAEPFPEVFYRGSERFLRIPELVELDAEAGGSGPALDENSHILVLGGAQGITPALVARFAATYPAHYILIGRSALSQGNDAYRELGSVDEIRNYLIGTEGMKQPREIEKRAKEIFKTNQIQNAIARIEETGARTSYHAVDVRDAEAFSALIAELKESYGSIDGVIHAAGILEDKLFRNKELESFKRVYGTKVDPLKPIVAELIEDLKLLVMFSSSSSTFGNVGQSDYAAGNSVMDNLALLLDSKYPDLRVVAFNWGPWKGAGMVNTGLEQEFRRRGIAFLPLEEGSGFFANELIKGDKYGVVALGGSKKGLENLFATLPSY
jgi:acyl transferase domain-containing protein/NAD(P)H-dependent flavin oxidoreductase YrpB (nitropropane dioxygenase family)/NAD(P)-dependent dehydrogenase (short-subunit alcohol dehydrogenase family)